LAFIIGQHFYLAECLIKQNYNIGYIYTMSDQPDETINDMGLTKPKKLRTEAQKSATERMRAALEAKHASTPDVGPKLSTDEKKLRLKALKEQLNGPSKKEKAAQAKALPDLDTDPETNSEPEEETPVPPPPPSAPKPLQRKSIKKEPKIVSQPATPKKQPKVVYETESESEEEIIVVKKRKKPKKKTIIYEDATESEEEEYVKPVKKERETKTQQNASSKFKVTPPDIKPKGPTYYFAD
jgi:hypothetical protein